jgi:polyphenol oxidase
MWRMNQVHGCHVLMVNDGSMMSGVLPTADAAVSSRCEVGVVVKVADCVPILVADRHGDGVAAIHAGWRGTAQLIARSTVETMAHACGRPTSAFVAALGPSIGACCYQVGADVLAGFEARAAVAREGTYLRWFSQREGDRLQLDLWRANRDQLLAAGVPASSIHVARLCTACHPGRFFSYRREGERAGRMLAAIRRRH